MRQTCRRSENVRCQEILGTSRSPVATLDQFANEPQKRMSRFSPLRRAYKTIDQILNEHRPAWGAEQMTIVFPLSQAFSFNGHSHFSVRSYELLAELVVLFQADSATNQPRTLVLWQANQNGI